MALTGTSEQKTNPSPEELRGLLDSLRPATVLRHLEGTLPPELVVFKAEALVELDRYREANDLLMPAIER